MSDRRDRLPVVQTAPRRPDSSVLIGHEEIERASVGESQRQLGAAAVELSEIKRVDRRNAPFDVELRRRGRVVVFRKALVNREMVVDAPETDRSSEYFAVVGRLLDESLHGGRRRVSR